MVSFLVIKTIHGYIEKPTWPNDVVITRQICYKEQQLSPGDTTESDH